MIWCEASVLAGVALGLVDVELGAHWWVLVALEILGLRRCWKWLVLRVVVMKGR